MDKIELGTKLYRAVAMSGIFEYTVTCLRVSERITQYEVECNTCKHGEKCKLLIGKNDFNQLIHIQMLNDDEDLCNEQRYWHCDTDMYFFTRKSDAEKQRIEYYLKLAKQEVEKSEKELKYRKESLKKMQDAAEALKIKVKESSN